MRVRPGERADRWACGRRCGFDRRSLLATTASLSSAVHDHSMRATPLAPRVAPKTHGYGAYPCSEPEACAPLDAYSATRYASARAGLWVGDYPATRPRGPRRRWGPSRHYPGTGKPPSTNRLTKPSLRPLARSGSASTAVHRAVDGHPMTVSWPGGDLDVWHGCVLPRWRV